MPGSIRVTTYSNGNATQREVFTNSSGTIVVVNNAGSELAVANTPDTDPTLGGQLFLYDTGGASRVIGWYELVPFEVTADIYSLAYQVSSGGLLACMIATSTLAPFQYPNGPEVIPGNVHQWSS